MQSIKLLITISVDPTCINNIHVILIYVFETSCYFASGPVTHKHRVLVEEGEGGFILLLI